MFDIPESAPVSDLASSLRPLLAFAPGGPCPLGSFGVLAAEAIPQPYRQLLVHDVDMTSTLARFFDDDIALRVLDSRREGGVYARRVLLLLAGSGRIVEYGGIEIHLDLLPAEASRLILEEIEPLGGILNRLGVSYRSQPRRFLRIAANGFLEKIFHHQPDQVLYGRCNRLSTKADEVFARIVEILPALGPDEEQA